MTICASAVFSTTANAAPLNLFRLNPNSLSIRAGVPSGTSATPAGDSTDSWYRAECQDPGDLSRHLRLMLRVVGGQWGFGIVVWLSEVDYAASSSPCDDFGRGVWPGAGGASSHSAGVDGFGGGGAPPIGGLGTRGDSTGFQPVTFPPSVGQTVVDGEREGDGPDDPVISPTGNSGRVPLFALFDAPSIPDAPDFLNGDEPKPADVTTSEDLRAESQPSPVPEPGSLLLLGSGLVAAAWRASRRTN